METTHNTATEGAKMDSTNPAQPRPSEKEMLRVLKILCKCMGRPVAHAAEDRATMRYMQRIGFIDERFDRKAGSYVVTLYAAADEFMAALT